MSSNYAIKHCVLITCRSNWFIVWKPLASFYSTYSSSTFLIRTMYSFQSWVKLEILRTLTCYRMTRHSSGHSFSISLKSYSSTHTKWLNLKWSPGQFRNRINTYIFNSRKIFYHFAFAGIKRKAPNLCLLGQPFTQPLPCSTIPVTLRLSGTT